MRRSAATWRPPDSLRSPMDAQFFHALDHDSRPLVVFHRLDGQVDQQGIVSDPEGGSEFNQDDLAPVEKGYSGAEVGRSLKVAPSAVNNAGNSEKDPAFQQDL